MFVILKQQAALDSLPDGLSVAQRRQAVFSTLTKQADQSQQQIRAALDRFGVPYTPYYLVNALEVQGNPIVRLWLSSRPEVDRILDNPTLRPLAAPLPVQTGNSSPPDGLLWNLSLIKADQVWNDLNVRGAGVIVGQSDSGVDGTHPELADSYRGANGRNDYNWWDPWYHTPTPTDIGGHGTHTLGTILGDHTGVAPDAQWIACVNLARNLGNPSFYLDCMQFMLAPFPQVGDPFKDGNPDLGAQVLNNSWGCPDIEGCDARVFQPAMQALKAAGIFVVASAGNDGPQCSSLKDPPPIYPDAFSVGAIDRRGQLASFSSLGPVIVLPNSPVKPNIVAPGVDVLSSLPENTYGAFSGTSMSGPHVVGTVALMWSANPKLVGEIDLTATLLEQAASHYQGSLPNCPGANQVPSTAVGYGVLDAYKAVQLALEAK
jgi:subtilisin family serine protease